MRNTVLMLAVVCAIAQCGKSDNVRNVHVVFSHHLDVGLDVLPGKIVDECVGFATSIVRRYFEEHIPRALSLAEESRKFSKEDSSIHRFVYQIHPWIASLYVNCVPWSVADGCKHPNISSVTCPTVKEVERFDRGVLLGDIVWAHSPFNINPEIAGEPSFFLDLPEIAGDLDLRYNRSTRGQRVWANVDVKGFARSAIPLLKRAGFQALYVGQNGGPTSPEGAKIDKGLQPVVGDQNATMFTWIDPPSGERIAVMYSDGYGGYQTRDQCIIHNGIALCSYFRKDNEGPPNSLDEVSIVFDFVRRNFPDAENIFASSFEAFASEALSNRSDLNDDENLPSTTLDWGDQWLTGVSTDPFRIAVFREMLRARAECLASEMCDVASPVMRNFTRFLAKNIEHTQGVQGEDWSPGIAGPLQKEIADTSHWSNDDFESVHNAHRNKFSMGDYSWLENRKFNDLALEALERGQHPLANDIRERLLALVPKRPAVGDLIEIANRTVRSAQLGVTLDIGRDGSLDRLAFDAMPPLESLFQLRYVTYNQSSETWDGRKNMSSAAPESRVWEPSLTNVWSNCSRSKGDSDRKPLRDRSTSSCTVVTRSTFDSTLHSKYGSPLEIFLTYEVRATRRVDVSLEWFNKSTTRLPESLTLSFRPATIDEDSGRWRADVLGSFVGIEEVAVYGTTNSYQRSTWTGVDWSSGSGHGFVLESLDAALACPITDGNPTILGGSTPMGEGTTPQHAVLNVTGMAYSLVQNLMPISGFPQWYPFGVGETYQIADEASKFRFSLRPTRETEAH